MPKEITWSMMKSFVSQRGISLNYAEFDNEYYIVGVDDSLQFSCTLLKDATDTTDLDDFEANYKPTANKRLSTYEISGVANPKGMRARLVGSHFINLTAGQVTNVDWQIPQLTFGGENKTSYFDGVEYYSANSKIGDTVTFQVVDKDGILYPAGTVVEEFATGLYVIPDQRDAFILYKAKLVPGLYIRVVYTSTGASNVDLICNLMRHLKE